MSTYVYRCKDCDAREYYEDFITDGEYCLMCDGPLVRAWRDEAVRMNRVPGGGREHRS